MKAKDTIHLGDGAYLHYDGHGFELRANDHEHPTDRVYLDTYVMNELLNAVNRTLTPEKPLFETQSALEQLQEKVRDEANDLIRYPRNAFLEIITKDSPYACYLHQWVPYQTEANRCRLKMRHDVKTFDGREAAGIWPNANRCGPFTDDEVEFIRISRSQE